MVESSSFINKYVTKRDRSMFSDDIVDNDKVLEDKISGKDVLVIGGAGSIGSAYIRAIIKYKPCSLTVVDINENGLAELTRDLRSTDNSLVPKEYITYAMDYSSPLFAKLFRKHKGYDIVANFSAHKHVRSEKDIISIEALIRNNLLNARKLLELLKEFPPEVYFCVSTDKAANPVNIMGASKRLMEDLIFSYSKYFPVKTARFANVAFSNGSLPDGFVARMSKGQPISAPSDVLRYFVSPDESGEICMLASILGNNREIFYPKLREETMMSFDKIAENYIQESGYEVYYCHSDEEAIKMAREMRNSFSREVKLYPVYFSKSNTSGEKEYEEFFIDSENVDESKFKSLGIICGKTAVSKEKIDILFKKFEDAFLSDNVQKEDIIGIIKGYLPEFMHIEKGKSLDEKM